MSRTGKSIVYRARLLFPLTVAIFLSLVVLFSVGRASAGEAVRFEVTIAHASNDSGDVDKRLEFAKKSLLGKGYKKFGYVRSYRFQLVKGKEQKFSVGRGISAVLGHAGVVGKRVQYYLQFYSGKQKKAQARVYYTIERGPPMITFLRQSGGWAYAVIVRALN